jgi:hypothetical protein
LQKNTFLLLCQTAVPNNRLFFMQLVDYDGQGFKDNTRIPANTLVVFHIPRNKSITPPEPEREKKLRYTEDLSYEEVRARGVDLMKPGDGKWGIKQHNLPTLLELTWVRQ